MSKRLLSLAYPSNNMSIITPTNIGSLSLVNARTIHPVLSYLGTPYTYKGDNKNPEFIEKVKKFRFEAVTKASGWLMNEFGWNVFSPITHSHPMHQLCADIRGDWAFWEQVDLQYIGLSVRMIILTISGWEKSTGLTAETDYARKIGLPIFYLHIIRARVFDGEPGMFDYQLTTDPLPPPDNFAFLEDTDL